MRTNTLSIHSENILPIIKKWLYSDKDIFLRELISNACDALNKVRIISGESEGLKVSVQIDKKAKTISVIDTGIGMTEEEVEKYIAQIAFSGAEEFVAKYSSASAKDPIIGHFGLGFYSAYMAASLVEIDTLSHLPDAKPVFWSCDGSSSYTIGEGKREERGTTIVLHIDDESLEYLEESKLQALLKRHCSFMPFPIDLNGVSLGNSEPLWKKNPSECTDKEYLDFYRTLFNDYQDPILWVHLNVDYPFNLQGILYFPKLQKRFDPNNSAIQLYCNRVFVSDNCKDILPDYLMVLKGAIDSPDIPLNVSRSYLQVDKNVRQLNTHIAKKVADKLHQLYNSDKEKYIACWPDIEMVVKLGILQDPKFYDKVKDILIWKNSKGEWAPLDSTRSKVFYTSNEHSPLNQLYKEEVIIASSPIDTALLSMLEEKLKITLQRVDGALDDSLIESAAENPEELTNFMKTAIPDLEIEAKNLTSKELPAIILIDEQQRRLRDYMQLTQGTKAFDAKKTLVVNTNNALIQAIARLQNSKPDVAKALTSAIYDLSLLAQRETDPADLQKVASNQTQILEKIVDLL